MIGLPTRDQKKERKTNWVMELPSSPSSYYNFKRLTYQGGKLFLSCWRDNFLSFPIKIIGDFCNILKENIFDHNLLSSSLQNKKLGTVYF